MASRFVSVLLVSAPLGALAAPVPPEDDAAKLRRTYGAWSDPDKDCSWQLTGGRLRVSLPATDHSLGGNVAGPANAPRVLGEVEGDFVATVKVAFPIPERVPQDPGIFFCSGGLLAWGADGDYVVIRRCALKGFVTGSGEAFWVGRQSGDHNTSTVQRPKKQEEAAFLRLRREGDKVAAGWSQDGKVWKEYEAAEVKWGQKVKVGVVAESTYKARFEVTFDGYGVSKPKK